MPVVMLVAAAVVLVGVVYVATGRGGELAFPHSDYAPLKLDEVTSTDVALFRPPTAVWGYSMQATDEALSRIANAITERDIEIAALQQRVADLQAAAAQRPGPTGPEDSSRREDPTSRLRRDWSARPPEPDTIGPDTIGPDTIGTAAEDLDIVLPDRLAGPDEPAAANREVPPPGQRPERDEDGGRDVWRAATRAARPPEPDTIGPDTIGPDTIGPDTIGTPAEDPDIVLPDRLAGPDEPAAANREVPPPGERPEWDEAQGSDVWPSATRAGRDVAPPDERPDRDEADGEDIWPPFGRAARPGAPRPAGDSGAPPMPPWLRRTRGGAASPTEWAALPKRSEPPAADDGEEDGS